MIWSLKILKLPRKINAGIRLKNGLKKMPNLK